MDALISLSGNVGTDVEFTQGEGWAYARFRLACTPRFLRNGEWTDAETTWISVRATNRLALNVRDSIKKGDPVVVMGKLRTHTWTNPEGERLDRLVVEATGMGHDLTRGTSAFIRTVTTSSPSDQEAAEMRESAEQRDGAEQREPAMAGQGS